MMTAFKLLTVKFWRRDHARLDDHLLHDLGLSRMEIQYRQS